MPYTKRALWLASNSDKGERLVQIALEHSKLAKQLSSVRQMGMKETSDVLDQISKLRAERESIIKQFEEKGEVHS